MESVRERLENTIKNSSVETMYDGEDCFITVTWRNETTGNESKWSFCVDFGDLSKCYVITHFLNGVGFILYILLSSNIRGINYGTTKSRKMD